jgi:hypothetical protein
MTVRAALLTTVVVTTQANASAIFRNNISTILS